jgi:hypothetical protein
MQRKFVVMKFVVQFQINNLKKEEAKKFASMQIAMTSYLSIALTTGLHKKHLRLARKRYQTNSYKTA